MALSIVLCNESLILAAKAQTDLPTAEQTSTQDLRERLQRLQQGAQATPDPIEPRDSIALRFPTLGSTVFDAQLASYLSYVETVGTPDILIVGSSRSLQGIDPTELRYRLSAQGHDDLKVYNFSVNGATAQVVNFIVSELLPGELPEVIVWGDGSRAFNEGRRDRTWESLLSSAGYQSVLQGEKPAIAEDDSESAFGLESAPASAEPEAAVADISLDEISLDEIDETSPDETSSNELTDSVVMRSDVVLRVVESAELVADAGEPARIDIKQLGIDRLGFSAVRDRFNPATYYREFAKVQGRYDGAYSPFILGGAQSAALAQLGAFLKTQSSRLIFVNLPLSDSYLDSYRLRRENQFRDFLTAQRDRHGFELIDLLTQWQTQPELFADPSHINLYGAAAIAQQLARHSVLLSAIDLEINLEEQDTLESPQIMF